MGRKRKEINPIKIYELSSQGMTQKEMAQELGVSHVTLAKRMGEIRAQQGILLDYRNIRSLHLTALQYRIIESITPEKIENASLAEKIKAVKILMDMELKITKPEHIKIKGLLYYLVEAEKREKYLKKDNSDDRNIQHELIPKA